MTNKRIPLKNVKNFGPVTLVEFEAMGINYLDEIISVGFEETCRNWVQYFPERLNANAFIGIACTIDGIVWTRATVEHKAVAHSLVQQLRKEFSLPPVKYRRKKK